MPGTSACNACNACAVQRCRTRVPPRAGSVFWAVRLIVFAFLAFGTLCDAERVLLFKMPYRHDRNKRTAILEVYNDETPQDIAMRFCEQHQLSVEHQSCLEGEITRRIQKNQSKRIAAASVQAPAAHLNPPVTMPTSGSATNVVQLETGANGAWDSRSAKGGLLFHMQFGVKGGSRRVDVHAGVPPTQIAKEFCKKHRLGAEHAATLVRQIEKKIEERGAAASVAASGVGVTAEKGAAQAHPASAIKVGMQEVAGPSGTGRRSHIDATGRDGSYPNLPKANVKRRRRRLQQQQPRSGSHKPASIETPTMRPIENVPQEDQSRLMAETSVGGGMLLYTLSVYINQVVHTMQVFKNAEILDMAKEFCERIGIDKEEEFILHLTVIDSLKRHHSQTLGLLKQGLPVMPLKIQF